MLTKSSEFKIPSKKELIDLNLFKEGDLIGDLSGNFKIAIAISSFNFEITSSLLDGAIKELVNHSVPRDFIKVAWVPGSFELPSTIKALSESGQYDAIIALGCLIKGDTDHYHYIANEVSRSLMDLSVNLGVPVIFGVLTCKNLAQAKDRCSPSSNKGVEAAKAALWMANLKKQLRVDA